MPKAKGGIVRDGNKWKISTTITINGRRQKIHKRGFESAYAAELALNDIKNKIDFVHGTSKNDYLSSALEDYYNYLETSFKTTTFYSVKGMLDKYVKNRYEIAKIKNITSYSELTAFREDINKLEIQTKYKNKVLRAYRNFITYCHQRSMATHEAIKNASLLLEPFREMQVVEKNEKPVWSPSEFKAFLSVIPRDSMDYVLFALWGHIGARIGEIRGLQVKHFNINRSTIFIEQAVVSKTGKGVYEISTPKNKSSVRKVPLSISISTLLIDYINSLELDNNCFLFSTAEAHDKPIGETTLRRIIQKYAKEANVKTIPPHSIRHSNITWLLLGTKSIEEIGQVSERVGHSNKTVTLNVYFHINKTDNKNLLETLSFMDD